MKEPYCPDCGVVQDLHSGIYCGIVKTEREKYERKLELVREMNRILRRDIDSLEDQGGIIDSLRAEHKDITVRLADAIAELEGIYGMLNGGTPSHTPSQTPQVPAIDQIRELKEKAADREADIKDLEEERDEWKQACEKVTADREVFHSERAHYREVFEDWERMVLKQPVAKRISELCGKVTLQSVQITDLTIERDSYKSMYQSSQDINASLAKEHNELKAAYEKLACSQPTPAEHLTSQMSKLITSMNEAGAAAVRPAPGRLEIAAMIYAAMLNDRESWEMDCEEQAKFAIETADTLITADQA